MSGLAEAQRGRDLSVLPAQGGRPCDRLTPLARPAFDVPDERTASPAELARVDGLKKQIIGLNIGINLDVLDAKARMYKATPSSPEARVEVESYMGQIHDAATLLYLQFNAARAERDGVTQFAAARLFNQLTQAAREIDEKHNLFDKSSIKVGLHRAIEQDIQREQAERAIDPSHPYDPRGIAEAMAEAASKRGHKDSWAWVMLPTYPKQHYGRILLDVITGEDGREVFVTQPTFVDGEATLFHTHGKNWAWSLPLGRPGSGENRHINTLWQPHSRDQLFPLRQMNDEKRGKAFYSAGDVAVIPPRTIHGISGSRLEDVAMSLDEVAKLNDEERRVLIDRTEIGNQSALHVYRADAALDGGFRKDPISLVPGTHEKDFFSGERNDMIVVDHRERMAWAGGGGAWDLRIKQFGPEGKHCGECFAEKDPREAVPDNLVLRRFIDPAYPGLILYPAAELAHARN